MSRLCLYCIQIPTPGRKCEHWFTCISSEALQLNTSHQKVRTPVNFQKLHGCYYYNLLTFGQLIIVSKSVRQEQDIATTKAPILVPLCSRLKELNTPFKQRLQVSMSMVPLFNV